MEKPKHPYLAAVGRRIRQLRKSKTDASMDDFAERIGFDRTQYGKAERGWANMEILTLIKIAKGLGAEVRDLLPDFDSQSRWLRFCCKKIPLRLEGKRTSCYGEADRLRGGPP